MQKVGGEFRWRKVPNLGSPQWTGLRAEVERLEKQKEELDRAMLDNPSGLRDEGEQTDDLIRLHQDYLDLTQQEARLELDKEDLQAQMIQRMEDFEVVAGVCSFPRSLRPILNGKSFCEAHRPEAAACSLELVACVRRTIYASRSY